MQVILNIPDEVLGWLLDISRESEFESVNECIEHILTGFCIGTIGIIEEVEGEAE